MPLPPLSGTVPVRWSQCARAICLKEPHQAPQAGTPSWPLLTLPHQRPLRLRGGRSRQGPLKAGTPPVVEAWCMQGGATGLALIAEHVPLWISSISAGWRLTATQRKARPSTMSLSRLPRGPERSSTYCQPRFTVLAATLCRPGGYTARQQAHRLPYYREACHCH